MFLTSWYTIFYLFSVLDRLSGLFVALTLISVWLAIVSIIVRNNSYTEEDTKATATFWSRIFPATTMLFLLLAVLVPGKKDMMLIVAGGAVGEFVMSNEDAKAIPAEVTKWLRTEIVTATEELNPTLQAKKQELMNLPQEELVKRLLSAKDSIH